MRPLITTSWVLSKTPGLATLLGAPVVHRWRAPDVAASGGVVAWGRKPSARAAEAYARRHDLKIHRLEDGFLRSVGLGKDEPPLSIVVDDLGIYYDATGPSRLEALIAQERTELHYERARALIAWWREARVSKYNHARESAPRCLDRDDAPYVLVVDQTLGDASITFGLADASTFQRMLAAALEENPGCTVVLKVHPEVMAGRKRGHFDLAAVAKHPRVRVLGEDLHPVPLIEGARAIYVVTSQMGFEGLLWGKRVRTFGMPFYAGWGLTADDLRAPARRSPARLEDLVHGALVDYPRYLHPETGARCQVEEVVAHLALQRRMRARFPPLVHALGFSPYKKAIVRRYFWGSEVRFVRNARRVPEGGTLVVWGSKPVAGAPFHCATIRLEDGFLRSVGLGADLVQPLSWVMDREGIYYDATQPSELESLLQRHPFGDALRARATRLRETVVRHGLTKYNVGEGAWQRPVHARRVILVPGQVERDASIRYGAVDVRTNLGLLQAVREANPDAHLIYKPHPDVRAGLRSGGSGEGEAASWCDEIVGDVPMQALLEAVDELHVLTSLAGFEALLRGKRVVTYGRPFYAGWGLTQDMAPPPRRSRRLTLEELVAGVLILYPAYVSRVTGRFTTPERALDELLAWRASGARRLPWWRKAMRRVLRFATA